MAEPLPLYFDHNATTPVLPQAVDAMIPFLREHHGNPSSNHPWGRRARAAVDAARASVAALIGARDDEVFFTSGGTEANNLAIRGVAARRAGSLISSNVEHPATAAPLSFLEDQGRVVVRVAVDATGRVAVGAIEAALNQGPAALVTLVHANNETGLFQPVNEAARLAHARGALVHTDAAQSVGKVVVDVDDLGVDLLSLVGHKLGAPKGVGALYVRRGTELAPLVLGAGHERGLRPGTENVASLVGFGVACDVVHAELVDAASAARSRRDRLWSLLERGVPGIVINGALDHCLPNTLSVRFPGVVGSALLAATSEVAASTGSACHDGNDVASSVITAMGIAPTAALGTVRLTLGRSTSDDDVERAGAALVGAWQLLARH